MKVLDVHAGSLLGQQSHGLLLLPANRRVERRPSLRVLSIEVDVVLREEEVYDVHVSVGSSHVQLEGGGRRERWRGMEERGGGGGGGKVAKEGEGEGGYIWQM